MQCLLVHVDTKPKAYYYTLRVDMRVQAMHMMAPLSKISIVIVASTTYDRKTDATTQMLRRARKQSFNTMTQA